MTWYTALAYTTAWLIVVLVGLFILGELMIGVIQINQYLKEKERLKEEKQ